MTGGPSFVERTQNIYTGDEDFGDFSQGSSTRLLYHVQISERALLVAVIHHDCLKLLESLIAYCPNGEFADKDVAEATYLDNLFAMKAILSAIPPNGKNIADFVCGAAYGGHLQVLQWRPRRVKSIDQKRSKKTRRSMDASRLSTGFVPP